MDCATESPWKTCFFELIGLKEPRLDVRWEPSPRDVVGEMIGMADVRDADVVYDLGCGDGRCVIAAARQTGARAVGVDLDPQRIRECRQNALREEVGGLVRFLNADLFETGIGEATVLFLFLFPHVNARLRPKLLAEARPGARIVSYCHDMERWEADRSIRVRANYLYLWIVPANVSGRWEGVVRTKGRQLPLRLELQQEFQMVSGMVSLGGEVLFISNTPLKGDTFRFAGLESTDGKISGTILNGRVKDDVIQGVILRTGRAGEAGAWTARLDPSTRTSLAK